MRPLLGFLVLVGACAEWPRLANIPDGDKIEDADVEPGDLVVIDWLSEAEAANNDQPNSDGLTPTVLEHGTGLVFTGALDGIGWADAATPLLLEDDNCPLDSGSRSPLGSGDYIEDVDFFVLAVAE